MRTDCLWIGIVATALVAPAAGEVAETRRLRANPQWNELRTQILAAASVAPSQAGRLQQAADLASVANPSVEGDLFDVVQVNGIVGKAIHAPLWPQPLTDAFAGVADALGVITEGLLSDFQEEIDTFLAANPGTNVSRQTKALDAAHGIVAKAAEQKSAARRAIFLRKAIDKVRTQKLFPYVAKPPKGKCPPRLDKGESAFGPWALYDFDSMFVEPAYFEANWGSAKLIAARPGFPEVLSIDFGYCDGRNKALTGFQADLPNPATGTFSLGNNVGGFQRGPGFTITMTAGSTITITALNREDGIVAGTFNFSASNGAGQGTGEFVLRIDP